MERGTACGSQADSEGSIPFTRSTVKAQVDRHAASSTAFSPTDVFPLAPWAKIAVGVQSLISLAVLGLVVARAVNVLGWPPGPAPTPLEVPQLPQRSSQNQDGPCGV